MSLKGYITLFLYTNTLQSWNRRTNFQVFSFHSLSSSSFTIILSLDATYIYYELTTVSLIELQTTELFISQFQWGDYTVPLHSTAIMEWRNIPNHAAQPSLVFHRYICFSFTNLSGWPKRTTTSQFSCFCKEKKFHPVKASQLENNIKSGQKGIKMPLFFFFIILWLNALLCNHSLIMGMLMPKQWNTCLRESPWDNRTIYYRPLHSYLWSEIYDIVIVFFGMVQLNVSTHTRADHLIPGLIFFPGIYNT